jgi:hypothetical protein
MKIPEIDLLKTIACKNKKSPAIGEKSKRLTDFISNAAKSNSNDDSSKVSKDTEVQIAVCH